MFRVRYAGCPRVQEMPHESLNLDASILVEVDKLWAEAQAEQGAGLSNGMIFSVSNIAGELITGRFVEYKYFAAARRSPPLSSVLQVRPLAVTGLSRCDDGVILGRRSARVTQDQGLWEFVPSGGIDHSSRHPDGSIDIVHQIEQELHEETGLAPALIARVSPRYVIEDTSSCVFDIVADVVLNISAEDAHAALQGTSPDEYERFDILIASRGKLLFEGRGADVAPLSRYMVEDLEMLNAV